MSKLVKLSDPSHFDFYINPDEVIAVIPCVSEKESILKTHTGQLRAIGNVDEIAAKLNVDANKVEQPEELNVNNVLIYGGKIYQAVKDKKCSACAFYETGKACDDNRGKCTDLQIHFRKVTQHE